MISRLVKCQLSSIRTSIVPASRVMSITGMRYNGMSSNMQGNLRSSQLKKTGQVLADGSKAEESLQQKRVHDNWRGYKSLQDKGSKTEAEQARPDDSS